jgi:hypothetical protein
VSAQQVPAVLGVAGTRRAGRQMRA